MLEFSDRTKPELENALASFKYNDIKPEKETNDTSKAFWNDIFSEKANLENEKVSEEDLLSDIFGVDADKFVFDFDFFDPEILSILDKFKDPAWNEKTDNEKLEIVKALIKVIGEKLGLTELPILELFDGEPFECGAFNAGNNVLKINKELLKDPKELVNTIAHELRHAYQNMRAMIGETYQDFLYLLNFIYYVTPEMGFSDYEDQLVEAEARAFANMFDLKGDKA